MRVFSLTMAASLLIGAFMPTVRAETTVRLTLASATPGGGFPVYADALIAALKAVDPSLEIEQRNTKGSGQNIGLLERREVDLALVQGESAYEALNGVGRAKADLRVFTAMYSAPGMFVVKAGSPYRAIGDLVGKPVAFGAAGSGLVILARYVLDGIGLSQTSDFDAKFLDKAGDGPQLVADGSVAALWGGGIGWPGFRAVANVPGGGRFIVPTADEIARIQRKHPFLKTLVVPAGTYPGQDTQLTSVGSWSFVMVRPSLDADVAYRLAKALHQAEADIAKRLPGASETTAANTLSALPPGAELHPGVQRYYRELGLIK